MKGITERLFALLDINSCSCPRTKVERSRSSWDDTGGVTDVARAGITGAHPSRSSSQEPSPKQRVIRFAEFDRRAWSMRLCGSCFGMPELRDGPVAGSVLRIERFLLLPGLLPVRDELRPA